MKKTILFLLITTYALATSYGQSNDNEPKVIVFKSDDGYNAENAKNEYSNAIKINPILVLNGDIPIYVERGITKNISIEFGAGVTTSNYFQSILDDVDDYFDDESERNDLFGYSINPSIRFYPSNEGVLGEGGAFVLDYRYRRYNSEFIHPDFSTPLDESISISEVRLLFSYIVYLSSNTFVDFYTGVGIRHRVDKMYEYNYTIDYDDFGSSIYTEEYTMTPKERRNALFALGFKIGFAF